MTDDDFPPRLDPAEWERLRALDRACDIDMGRYVRNPHGGASRDTRFPERVWVVTIHRRAARHYDAVRVMRHRLTDAVRDALAQAERQGWHEGKG